ncbi:hypothetical protein [Synechococcus sp. MIT S1220]|uniref:hypothetical protein n=1 Tax=Synechococcus sp. MIT S1220 TaxID=3082549 RepID=UPI0039B04FCB
MVVGWLSPRAIIHTPPHQDLRHPEQAEKTGSNKKQRHRVSEKPEAVADLYIQHQFVLGEAGHSGE